MRMLTRVWRWGDKHLNLSGEISALPGAGFFSTYSEPLLTTIILNAALMRLPSLNATELSMRSHPRPWRRPPSFRPARTPFAAPKNTTRPARKHPANMLQPSLCCDFAMVTPLSPLILRNCCRFFHYIDTTSRHDII